MIGRLMDDGRRRWRRSMVEAGTNVAVSTMMATMVRHGEKHRREEDKKLKWEEKGFKTLQLAQLPQQISLIWG